MNGSFVDITISLNTMMLLLGVARQQPKQIFRVKLPSLLAVEIPADDSYSSASLNKMFLVALVAASHLLVQVDVGMPSRIDVHEHITIIV